MKIGPQIEKAQPAGCMRTLYSSVISFGETGRKVAATKLQINMAA